MKKRIDGFSVVGATEPVYSSKRGYQWAAKISRHGFFTRVVKVMRIDDEGMTDIRTHLDDADATLSGFNTSTGINIPAHQWCLIPAYRVPLWRQHRFHSLECGTMIPPGFFVGARVEAIDGLPVTDQVAKVEFAIRTGNYYRERTYPYLCDINVDQVLIKNEGFSYVDIEPRLKFERSEATRINVQPD